MVGVREVESQDRDELRMDSKTILQCCLQVDDTVVQKRVLGSFDKVLFSFVAGCARVMILAGFLHLSFDLV